MKDMDDKNNKKDMAHKVLPPRLPEPEKFIGPEFLTVQDFKTAINNYSPELIEARFIETGIAIPKELIRDMEKLKGYSDDAKELYESWQMVAEQMNGETMRFWCRLQSMGFSPEIIEVSLEKDFLRMSADGFTAFCWGMIEPVN